MRLSLIILSLVTITAGVIPTVVAEESADSTTTSSSDINGSSTDSMTLEDPNPSSGCRPYCR